MMSSTYKAIWFGITAIISVYEIHHRVLNKWVLAGKTDGRVRVT